MTFEAKDGIGLAPYPTPEAVRAKIEFARRWRNGAMRSAMLRPLRSLARSMRTHDAGAPQSTAADHIGRTVSSGRSAVLLWHSAIIAVLLAAALCVSVLGDRGKVTFVGAEMECMHIDAAAIAGLKPLLDQASHGATMAAIGALRRIAAARAHCASGSVDRAMGLYRESSLAMTRFHDRTTFSSR